MNFPIHCHKISGGLLHGAIIYLFTYWQHWVFVAVTARSLSSRGEQELLFITGQGLLSVFWPQLVAAHGLESAGAVVLGMGVVAL